MADSKITALTANTTPAVGDLLPIVDDPSGVASTQKITLENVFKVINGLTTDSSPDTAADYVVTYDASASGAKKVLLSSIGGGGLTASIASVTTSNVTGVTGTHHILDISGMTANRDFNLPTPTAAGQRCRVTLSTGDATYALIIKVNSIEVTRLFITNETLEYVSTGTGAGNWQLSDDGRISSIGIMERQTAQSINSATDTKIQLATKVKDVGDICDNVTNYRITVRRTGTYDITAYASLQGALDDQEVLTVYLYINGVVDRLQQNFVSFATADRIGVSLLNIKKQLTAGDYLEMNVLHTEGAAVNTNTTYYPQLSVVELETGGGSTGGGGGGDALTTNPLSQFAATTSAQLAGVISDETGTGALVFANSPTLVTPALGTPSALTLTNATGLPTAGLVDGAVTLAKLVDASAQYNLLGRSSSGSGDFEQITSSANGFSLLQAADYAAMLTLLFGVALPENTAIQLDAALSADGKYSGIVLPSQTAGTTLAFGDLCYLQTSDSRWELVDADAEATCSNMLGMCVLAAAADGSATTILVFGKIRADANFPALTIGAPVYASTTAGDVQVTAPSGTLDIVRKVGHALTADELFFNPSNDYYEIA